MIITEKAASAALTPAQRRTINYITDLAGTVAQNISDWDIDDIFGDGEDMVHSPNEINKRFFETIAIRKIQENKALVLTPDQVELIRKTEAKALAGLKITHEDNTKKHVRNISDYASRLDNEQKLMAKSVMMAEAMSIDLVKEINEICKGPFFTFAGCDDSFGNSSVSFITRPITLQFTRSDQKVIRVPMGQYKVDIYPSDFFMRLYPHTNNVRVKISGGGTYYHVFVSGSGEICWGTGQNVAAQFIANGKWAEVMKLLSSLLVSYPGGTPYASLEQFYFKGLLDDGTQPWRDPNEKPLVGNPPGNRELNSRDLDADGNLSCRECGEDHEFADHPYECPDCGAEYTEGEGHDCDPEGE